MEGFEDIKIPDNDILQMFKYLVVALKKNFDMFTRIIINLNERKYIDARTNFGINDDFAQLMNEIVMRRIELKSLLKGIIRTSSLSSLQQVHDYLRCFKPCNNDVIPLDTENSDQRVTSTFIRNSKNSGVYMMIWSDTHDLLLSKLLEVNSMDDLFAFNNVFHRIIVDLFSDLLLIFETRTKYTIDYALGYPELYETFGSLKIDFEKFIKEITVVRLKLT
jgi:hypothetical protein